MISFPLSATAAKGATIWCGFWLLRPAMGRFFACTFEGTWGLWEVIKSISRLHCDKVGLSRSRLETAPLRCASSLSHS